MPHISAKAMATEEKEKKDKCFQTCLERRNSFTQILYSADGIPRTEAVAAERRLASLLINKLKREYLEMCGFIRVSISLAIVRSNTLLLQGTRNKEAYIRQRTGLADGALMVLIAPWQG